ncbi:MAG: isoprenylcysteine carboxylmethyltransferase family protein [Bacteroidota bacterium]
MKKLISTFILCSIICCLPIIGKPELYLSKEFLTIVFFFFLLFFTQPTFEASDIKTNSETDKFSMLFILISLIIVLSGSIIDWAYFQMGLDSINKIPFQYFGLILLLLGSSIRIWAILHLGKYFSNAVSFNSEHKLIKSGPYKLIRHPSYLGAYLAIIGSALFLKSIVFFLIGLIVMLSAYLYRIKVEEIGLIELFGSEYQEYKKKSKKMIPFVY